MAGKLKLLSWLPLGMKAKQMYDKGNVSTAEVDELLRDVAKKFVSPEAHPTISSLLRDGDPLPVTMQAILSSDEALDELESLRLAATGSKGQSPSGPGEEYTIRCPHCNKYHVRSI
jgi:hypothetical protein